MAKDFSALLLIVVLSTCPSWAMAQEAVGDPYLAGVSAYNSGDHEGATEQLTAAIEESPQDPRAYYYRGLAKLALGEQVEGTDDLRQAATLELAGGWSYAAIDRALATVQGSARTTVERVRRDVRLAAERVKRSEPARQRRAAWEAEEKKVLRTRTELPIEALVNQLTPDQALAAAQKSRGAVEEYVAEAEKPEVAVAENTAEANPFADEPNPFAEDPAADMPEAEPTPVAVTQPDDSPFTDDPFLQPGPQQPRANPPVAGGPAPGGAPPGVSAEGIIRGLSKFWFSGKADGLPIPGQGAPPGGGFGPPDGGGGFGPPNGGGFGPPGDAFGEEEMTPEAPEEGEDPADEDDSPFVAAPEEGSPFDSPEAEDPGMMEPDTDEGSPFDTPEGEGPEMEGEADANPFGAPN